METIVCHYWKREKDGSLVLYEAAYRTTWMRPGVVCHVKVACSDRPCDCPERESRMRTAAAALN